jgi:CubicO group peptidase (beta-lactamase class C family)
MRPPKVTKKLAVSNLKTRFKVVSFWLLIMGVGYLLYFCVNMFPVIAGYGAKNLCSCVYIQGRSEEDVISQEFNQFLGKFGTFSVNPADSSATGSVWFFTEKKAIYRKGLGCTLIVGTTEDELRGQNFYAWIKNRLIDNDTIVWPDGNKIAEGVPLGIDKGAINKIVSDFFVEKNPSTPYKTRGVVVVYDGMLVSEQYGDGYTSSTPQMAWSMTKGVSNALIGILVNEGRLKIDDPVSIDAWKYDDRKNITINDLLHASSGLDWSEHYSRPSDATEMLFQTKDVGLFAISKKSASKPNEKFYYSSGTTNILSWIIRQEVGENFYHRFPYQRLFNKIGMNSAILEADPTGTYILSSYSYATPRDWARFGLLYANDGVWNGVRLLPEGWVKYTATPGPAAKQREYGAQWRLNVGEKNKPETKRFPSVPDDALFLRGVEGQLLFVIPSKKLVVVRMGLSLHGDPDMDKFISDIIGALPK